MNFTNVKKFIDNIKNIYLLLLEDNFYIFTL